MYFKKLILALSLMLFLGQGHATQPLSEYLCGLQHSNLEKIPGHLYNQFGIDITPRKLEEIPHLRVGSFNTLNLYESRGKHLFEPKPLKDQIGVARAMLDSNLDIITLIEVEGKDGKKTLDRFNQEFLFNQYDSYLIDGNDSVGIDVGFLVKKNLPFRIEHVSHKDRMWMKPGANSPNRVFSRDLPMMKVFSSSTPGNGPPLLVILGTHYKSQRTYKESTDPGGKILRGAQVQETVKIINEINEQYQGQVPIALMGDFNGDIHGYEEFGPLFEQAHLKDSFDLVRPPVEKEQRTTHTYHPDKHVTINSQLDGVLVSEHFQEQIQEAYVYRYKDEFGNPLPLPVKQKQRNRNPSDHFMVVTQWNFQPLIKGKTH